MNLNLHNNDTQFADIQWRNSKLRLEYQWVGARHSEHPVIVFLHEGLGSVALWKDFPESFCSAHGFTGLVFSRYGYGLSSPRPAEEKLPVSFMHEQAHQVLPAFFSHLGITRPWLFGHSDGASIALLYAARFPSQLSGIVVAAPHIFVEDITIASIRTAREVYLTQNLRAKLAPYHADVDSAFWGWNDIWLDPAFRAWNIEQELTAIACPVLAIQGEDDEYGTLEQVYGLKRKTPQTEIVLLPQCGHSPHRDQPEALSREAAQFIASSV
ncbi:alpha/beta fold hydrolase [Herminiimonas sp. CN]|uniref:alpha/beta fold hydrolase n=1 Tax=Herminiimonas sp. CN TaxID=1349818 RepID=UPI0004735315|nr:alpha/beta hydrolase [Herminiimonas sp. CN]